MKLCCRRLIPTPYTNYKSQTAKKLAAQYLVVNHIFDNIGHRETIDTLLKKYPERWLPSLSNELGGLAQGVQEIKGNNAILFIPDKLVPKNKKVAYASESRIFHFFF